MSGRSPVDLKVLHAVLREKPDGTAEELTRWYNGRVGRALGWPGPLRSTHHLW